MSCDGRRCIVFLCIYMYISRTNEKCEHRSPGVEGTPTGCRVRSGGSIPEQVTPLLSLRVYGVSESRRRCSGRLEGGPCLRSGGEIPAKKVLYV